MNYLLVAIGSAMGGVLRYWISVLLFSVGHGQFPWPTLTVNVLGSAVIGIVGALATVSARWSLSGEWGMLVAIGVLGGFTTFSTFSLQVVYLFEAGKILLAGSYMLASLVLCVGFAALGFWFARSLL